MGVGLGVGGCQPFETIQGAATPPLSWPVGVSGPQKGSARGKPFSCGFCVWFTLNEAGSGFVVCFPTFQREDDGWLLAVLAPGSPGVARHPPGCAHTNPPLAAAGLSAAAPG